MPQSSQNAWRSRCVELNLDPQEIKAVSRRFDMYHEYTTAQGGDTLPIDRWYGWYRVEKLSEGHAMQTPPVQGCSVEVGTERTGAVISEPDFLQVLLMYRDAAGRR